jgi:uncharacterized protein YndB with AHSA1/START domain
MRLTAVLLFAACFARAEIVESGPGGFTVKTTLNIKAPPDDVYRKFMHDIGEWWNPVHTFSGDAHNLRIEDHPGGCLCEKLPNNGFTRHLELITLVPGKRLVLSGAMGPLQTLSATGTMQFVFTPSEGGTKLDAIYAVAGYLEKGMNSWAIPVDMMLAEQVSRFKSYVETGHAAASK